MSLLPGMIRCFRYGEGSDSWCTKCSGLRCKEKVGFLFDKKGKVQGYIIDSERLRGSTYIKHRGDNRRLKGSSPPDGIYKRPLDVKQLISRNRANVNKVRFSNDLLRMLLIGVEGCDDFIKGKRDVSHENISKRKGFINLNMKAGEVLRGERKVEDIICVEGSEKVYNRRPGSNPLTRGY